MANLDEAVRSDALRRYDILNTPPEPNFDRLTRLAAVVLGRPVCTLSLADSNRFWFKSKHGVDSTEMPRQMAFCEQTIEGDGVFVVHDARNDARFANAPVVKNAPYFRFYAGAPLVTPGGVRIGSLCVLDFDPRPEFSHKDRSVLADLASTAMELFEARAYQIELARCTDEIAHLARHDGLTGLPNRRRLTDLFQISEAEAARRGIALLYLDLDGFKAVNDRHGHACGDGLLRQVAERVVSCLPPNSSVARIGGDEFAVLLTVHDADLESAAAALARRLIDQIACPYQNLGSDIRIGCSIGIAVAEDRGPFEDLLERADAALYQAKSNGRGRYMFADGPEHPERSTRMRRTAA